MAISERTSSMSTDKEKQKETRLTTVRICKRLQKKKGTHVTKNSRTTPQHSPSSAQLTILSPIIASSPHCK